MDFTFLVSSSSTHARRTWFCLHALPGGQEDCREQGCCSPHPPCSLAPVGRNGRAAHAPQGLPRLLFKAYCSSTLGALGRLSESPCSYPGDGSPLISNLHALSPSACAAGRWTMGSSGISQQGELDNPGLSGELSPEKCWKIARRWEARESPHAGRLSFAGRSPRGPLCSRPPF